MKVVIVGAAGQLGTALLAEFEGAGWPTIPLTRSSLDVTRLDATRAIVDLSADVIINASAWNDVDGAEDDPATAFAVNRDGVFHLAEAARRTGARLVQYSTDFVFGGRAAEPYGETAAVSPLNVYGESKLAGEQMAAIAPQSYVLRLASVFGGRPGEGAGGRGTIDRMIDAVLAGRPVRAFVDRTVSPSYTVDVARATRLIVAGPLAPGVYHCVNTGFATWFDLAHEISRAVGIPASIAAVRSEEAPLRARRPRFCALSNSKLTRAGIVLPSWEDAVRRHLSRRACGALTVA